MSNQRVRSPRVVSIVPSTLTPRASGSVQGSGWGHTVGERAVVVKGLALPHVAQPAPTLMLVRPELRVDRTSCRRCGCELPPGRAGRMCGLCRDLTGE